MENEEMTMGDFMDSINKSMKKIQVGDILKGNVIAVNDSNVIVNIGYIADGILLKEEITSDPEVNLSDLVSLNDEVYVYVEEINDGEGNVLLSKKKADSLKVWDDLEESYSNGKEIEAKITEVVKGGVVADLSGVRAFIPASQLSINFVENLNEFLGKVLTFKVIELDKEDNKVILSRKIIEAEERELQKDALWGSIKKGMRVKGKVTRLAKFGAFVDLGGMDGLIHISELSWKRVSDPSEVVSVGDEVEVYVLDADKDKNRISLALKEVNNNPWNTIESKFKVNDVVEGRVTNFINIGAFVEIAPGIEGMVHISEISEDRIAKPSDKLNLGDIVKVKILDINLKERRISLSIKSASILNEEYKDYIQKSEDSYSIGDLLKDKLKGFKFEE